MAMALIKCSSSSTASNLVDEVETGTLWGVSLGTTTRATKYSNFCLLDITETRAMELYSVNPLPETYEFCTINAYVDSFSESGTEDKVWYLRGKLEHEGG